MATGLEFRQHAAADHGFANQIGNAAEVATHESTVDVFGARYVVVTNRSRDCDGLVASDEAIA